MSELENLTIALSPLTGRIFAGYPQRRDSGPSYDGAWRVKRDITEAVLGAACEHVLRDFPDGGVIGINRDGKPFATLTVEPAKEGAA